MNRSKEIMKIIVKKSDIEKKIMNFFNATVEDDCGRFMSWCIVTNISLITEIMPVKK